jgi:hypothetical protein
MNGKGVSYASGHEKTYSSESTPHPAQIKARFLKCEDIAERS